MDSTIPIIAVLPAFEVFSSTHCLTTPMFTAWIFLFLIALIVSSIHVEIKTTFILLILMLYWRNMDLLLNLFAGLYYPSSVKQFTVETAKCALLRHFNIQHSIHNSKPTIYVCNYAHDRFENAFILFLPKPFVILVSDAFATHTDIEELVSTVKVPANNSYSAMEFEIKKQLENGKNIVCYSQKPLYVEGKNYGRIRKGLFYIAQENPNMTITPLYIQPIQTYFRAIVPQAIHMIAGRSMKVVSAPVAISRVKSFFNRMDSIFNENK